MKNSMWPLCLLALLALNVELEVEAHEFYPGQCPQLRPMADFNWDQVTAVSLKSNLSFNFSLGSFPMGPGLSQENLPQNPPV